MRSTESRANRKLASARFLCCSAIRRWAKARSRWWIASARSLSMSTVLIERVTSEITSNPAATAYSGSVSPSPFADFIRYSRRLCQDRAVREKTVQIVGQFLGSGIAGFRILGNSLMNNCFQLSGERPDSPGAIGLVPPLLFATIIPGGLFPKIRV